MFWSTGPCYHDMSASAVPHRSVWMSNKGRHLSHINHPPSAVKLYYWFLLWRLSARPYLCGETTEVHSGLFWCCLQVDLLVTISTDAVSAFVKEGGKEMLSLARSFFDLKSSQVSWTNKDLILCWYDSSLLSVTTQLWSSVFRNQSDKPTWPSAPSASAPIQIIH